MFDCLLVDKGMVFGLFENVESADAAMKLKKLSDAYSVIGFEKSELQHEQTRTLLSYYNSINSQLHGMKPLVKFQNKDQAVTRLHEVIVKNQDALIELGKTKKKATRSKRSSSGGGKVFDYPREGSKTREIWEVADKMKGKTAGEVFDALTKRKKNPHKPNTVRTQYNRWKKHHEAKG